MTTLQQPRWILSATCIHCGQPHDVGSTAAGVLDAPRPRLERTQLAPHRVGTDLTCSRCRRDFKVYRDELEVRDNYAAAVAAGGNRKHWAARVAARAADGLRRARWAAERLVIRAALRLLAACGYG